MKQLASHLTLSCWDSSTLHNRWRWRWRWQSTDRQTDSDEIPCKIHVNPLSFTLHFTFPTILFPQLHMCEEQKVDPPEQPVWRIFSHPMMGFLKCQCICWRILLVPHRYRWWYGSLCFLRCVISGARLLGLGFLGASRTSSSSVTHLTTRIDEDGSGSLFLSFVLWGLSNRCSVGFRVSLRVCVWWGFFSRWC